MSRGVRVNERIRIKEVRVINPEGEQLGILPIQEALQTAQSLGLDLVEVAPEAKPPVCRIMNYGKYRYEQNKKTREAKKKQTIIQVKEIKLRPKTENHDFQFKARHAERFLKEGNKTKVTMMFRGREMVHLDRGRVQLDRFADTLKEVAVVEQQPRLEGRNMVMILTPKH
ncbi:MAG: translation initiation factor IF-3 [Candidatus Methylomirabilis oxyfera]|nr:translation initiation factor IF-3 [Candidatus Methylomirabilis oxyfera]